jgi:hypothetical protein
MMPDASRIVTRCPQSYYVPGPRIDLIDMRSEGVIGFMENRYGQLTWHGRHDIDNALALTAAAVIGLVAGHVRDHWGDPGTSDGILPADASLAEAERAGYRQATRRD